MIVSPPILAQPLAPDNVWFALLLLAALAWIRRLDALKSHVAAHRHTRHHLHEIGHRLHERMAHWHH